MKRLYILWIATLLVTPATLSMAQCQGGRGGGGMGPMGGGTSSGTTAMTSMTTPAASASLNGYQSTQALQQFVMQQQRYIQQLEANQRELMAELQRLRSAQGMQVSAPATLGTSMPAARETNRSVLAEERRQQNLRRNAEIALASAQRSEQIGNVVNAERLYRRVMRILPGSDLAQRAASRLQ